MPKATPKRAAITRLTAAEMDATKVQLAALTEAVAAQHGAAQHFTMRIAELDAQLAKAETELASAKADAEKRIAAAKKSEADETKKVIGALAEIYRRVSGSYDATMSQLARAKDALA